AQARAQGWLARSPLAYLVLDREAGEFFLRSRAAAFPGRQIAGFFGIMSGPLWDHIDANILNLTGAQHRRLRTLVGRAFTPRAAGQWRPVMRDLLARLWDEVPAGHGEFMGAVARPYPALTIAAVLGAPAADAAQLQEWSNLASAFLAAEDDGERLSHAECVNPVVNVLAGAIDTTQSQLGHALRLFAARPEQWARLAAEPALVPRAVQEVLRFEPITPFTARICLEDIEYRDVTFPAGTIVAVCAERGNRQVGGEEFDITAERGGGLLTFGAGPHFCLGVNLARAELEEALTFLAPRMPGLTLAGDPELGGVEGIYGIDRPPLRWAVRTT
ncbi:MAG TPA: cytochrome P450, partial [Streptosporangiaceae bacterium]|nr:cytochrome P450 [Streptosporangiaceae bacterium]